MPRLRLEAWFGKQSVPACSWEVRIAITFPGPAAMAIRDPGCGGNLVDAGHRRIIYLLHNCYGVQMIEPFQATLESRGVPWDERYHVLRWKDDPANLYPLLERLFGSARPPTAFVALGIGNLLPLITWTAQHGLRVPVDISIIQILDDPMLELIYPPITRYVSDRDKLCHAVVELVLRVARTDEALDVAAMIPMTLVPGRSVGPPRRR